VAVHFEEEVMTQLATLATFLCVAVSSAWAQTTAPGGATGAPEQVGSIGDYWWIILIVVVLAIALWYFSRNRRNRTGV
jgi:LPXTG-motif cell wall-anchored protein